MKKTALDLQFESEAEAVTERDAARRYAARWKEVARRAHSMSVAGWYEVGLAWDERHAADRRAEEAEARTAELEAVCRDARSTVPDGKPGSQNAKVRAALDAVLGRGET